MTRDDPSMPQPGVTERYAVESGFTDAVLLRSWGTFSPPRILFYPDGRVAVEHRCRMIDDNTRLICAPRLVLGDGDDYYNDQGHHRIESRNPLTIKPSIDCPDCDLHGFVEDGYWRQALRGIPQSE